MAEYIERAVAVKAVLWERKPTNSVAQNRMLSIIQRDLLTMPAADVAPVVRCKDCVRWDDDPDTYGADGGPKGKCMKSFETMCADDFCSYGERKENNHEKV